MRHLFSITLCINLPVQYPVVQRNVTMNQRCMQRSVIHLPVIEDGRNEDGQSKTNASRPFLTIIFSANRLHNKLHSGTRHRLKDNQNDAADCNNLVDTIKDDIRGCLLNVDDAIDAWSTPRNMPRLAGCEPLNSSHFGVSRFGLQLS